MQDQFSGRENPMSESNPDPRCGYFVVENIMVSGLKLDIKSAHANCHAIPGQFSECKTFLFHPHFCAEYRVKLWKAVEMAGIWGAGCHIVTWSS